MNKDLRIEIRPIPNRHNIRKFSPNLEYFSQAHILSPLVDPDTHQYVSGLSTEDLNYLKDRGFPYDTDTTYIRGVAHKFWESSIVKVELTNSPMFLYPGKNPIDLVKYKYLLKSSFIYASEIEMKSGNKARATHYIFDESEENKIKAKRITKRNNLLSKVGELSLSEKRKVIMILLNENTENKNEDYLTVRFEDLMSKSDTVKELELLLEKTSKEVDLAATVKDAIHKNVLRRTKEGIFFFDNNIGFDEETVINFLGEVTNQELLINIKEKITN